MILRTATRAVRFLVELVIILIAAFALAFIIRAYVADVYVVPTGSMKPTIEEQDRIVAEKITLYKKTPEKGDIITFISPMDGTTTLVKRLIAEEGDTVDIQSGNLYINGFLQEEEYVHGKLTYELNNLEGISITYPYTVPEGYVWVMGDNRTNSEDSRYFGPIDTATITGRVLFRFWPFSRAGSL